MRTSRVWWKLYAEWFSYHKEANRKWVGSSLDKMKELKDSLLASHSDWSENDFTKLGLASQRRIQSVGCCYTNVFAELYKKLGKRAETFIKFEKGLASVVPIVEHALPSATNGRGRNARFGVARCADVVVRLTIKGTIYVGLLEEKMIGGKCEPNYTVNSDGELVVGLDSVRETAIKEFMEETGAGKINTELPLSGSQLSLLDEVTTNWRDVLEQVGCAVTHDEKVTWNLNAKEKVESGVREYLQQCIENIPVPDSRTTKNAGYATTIFDLLIKDDNHELKVLLLTLNGADEGRFSFCPISAVHMQSTHKEIFDVYLQCVGVAN